MDQIQNTETQRAADTNPYPLNPIELWWRDRYHLLLDRGYQLRPRLRPDWKPSWQNTKTPPELCEDSLELFTSGIVDASRVSDNRLVVIKKALTSREEARFSEYFSATERASDVENHCVPLYSRFLDTTDPEVEFIVMPLLRSFDSPPFKAVGEVLDFVTQTLEGLRYMHKEGVAHRDCAGGNIMMDATSLFPDGFHPVFPEFDRSGLRDAVGRRRIDSAPVKYYFIDFGLSVFVSSGEEFAIGSNGQDRDVPELSDSEPYKPFPVDVFILGNTYKKSLLDIYSNLDFLYPLVDAMTRKDPQARPTSAEAYELYKKLPLPMRGADLRWRLRFRDENVVQRAFGDTIALAREGAFLMRSVLSAPMKVRRQAKRDMSSSKQ